MHSCGMRTARLLTVSQHALPGGVCPWSGGRGVGGRQPRLWAVTITLDTFVFFQSSTALSSKTETRLIIIVPMPSIQTLKFQKNSQTKRLQYSLNLINAQKTCCHDHITILAVGPT